MAQTYNSFSFLCYLQNPRWYVVPGAAPLSVFDAAVRGREWWLFVENNWDDVYY
jgi:hypothetical protein